jgi:phospholipid transport system substrate-binding protein
MNGSGSAFSRRLSLWSKAWLLRASLLGFGCVLSGGLQATMADPGAEAQQIVRASTDKILSTIRAENITIEENPVRAYELAQQYVEPYVDFEQMARLVLGKYWRNATDDQRARFTTEFQILLFRSYATAVTDNPDVTVDYLPSRVSENKNTVMVRTQIPQANGPAIQINYRMYNNKGDWMVFDFVVEGISLVQTYRTSFTNEARRGGIDGLIQRLSEKNRKRSPAAATDA